jgi:RecJ-like exonuclease
MRITGIQVRWVCDQCDGTGTVRSTLPYCRICHRTYTHADLALYGSDAGWDDILPCTHHQHDIREHHACVECNGRGWGQGWVPVEELRRSLVDQDSVR